MRRRWWGTLAILGGALGGGSARAQAAEPDDAQALVQEGHQLAAAGRWDEACHKLASSKALEPAAGTVLDLADCYEHTGKTASAWTTWVEGAALAEKAGQSDRAAQARDRASLLEPVLSRLTIRVAGLVPGIVITRDDMRVDAASFGVAVPVDPGTHTVRASMPGHLPWSQVVSVPAGPANVEVVIPVPDQPVEVPRLRQPDYTAITDQRIAALIVGGIGLAALGLGTAFAVTAHSKWSDAESQCVQGVCTAEGFRLNDEGNRMATGATVSLIGGGIMVITGGVLWFTSHPTKPMTGALPPSHAIVTPTWASGPMLVMSGAF
jgi:hypothetical protein